MKSANSFVDVMSSLICSSGFVGVTIGLGLLIRIFAIVLMPVQPMSDFAWYIARAEEIAAGLGYQEAGLPTAFWPVGWPAIIAGFKLIFGSTSLAVAVINLASAVVTMVTIVWIGRRVLNDELTARIAVLLYALYPNHIAYTGVAASEPIYAALATLALAVTIVGRHRAWLLALAGTIFGVCTLLKPQTIIFPFGLVIAMFLALKDVSVAKVIKAMALVYICLLFVVLPWSFRNLEVFGKFTLVSTNGGIALLIGANDEMTGDHFEIEKTKSFERIGIPWAQRVARQTELDARGKALAVDWIHRNTTQYILWMPRKVGLLWHKDTDGFWSYDFSYPKAGPYIRFAQISNQLYYLAALVLALWCAVLMARQLLARGRDSPLLLIFCAPAYVSLLAAVFTGQIRYHHFAMPFVFLAAAWVVAHWKLFAQLHPSSSARLLSRSA